MCLGDFYCLRNFWGSHMQVTGFTGFPYERTMAMKLVLISLFVVLIIVLLDNYKLRQKSLNMEQIPIFLSL